MVSPNRPPSNTKVGDMIPPMLPNIFDNAARDAATSGSYTQRSKVT